MGKKKKIKKDPLAGDAEVKLEFPIKTEENPLASEDEVCEESDAIKLEVMHIAAAEYSDEEEDEKPKKKQKREIDPTKLIYHCNQCSSSFTSKVGLKSHVWNEHTKEYGDYTCDVCDKRFKTEKILGRHKKLHTSNSHKCNICLKKFTTKTIVTRHIATVHAEDRRKKEKKEHVCPHCGKGFISKHGFAKHLTIHSDERPFECPECPLRFKNKSALDKHGSVHTRPYSCSICNMTFSRRSGLELHSSKHQDKSLKCPYCAKSFTTNENMRLHCERHHPGLPHEPREGPVLCTICNEIYENLEVLKNHAKIHPIVRKYECEICETKFFTKHAMIKHIKHVHLKTNRRVKATFPCTVCNKTYFSLRFLMRHKCSTDDRPYKCTICSKGFNRKKTLDDHQAVHSEKRSMYSCKDCEKKFNWRSGLRKHVYKHHGKNLQTGSKKSGVKVGKKSSTKKIKEEVI